MVVVLRSPPQSKIGARRGIEKLYWGDLDGRTWTKWSISIWDIVKTPEERRLGHPAMFPVALCERLIRAYTRMGEVVLDPFMGSGSTLVAARRLFRKGVGFEIYEHFVETALRRLREGVEDNIELFIGGAAADASSLDVEPVIVVDEARNVGEYLERGSVDMVLTSPPYFNVHLRERTSDRKESRPYGGDPRDLGNIEDYVTFMRELLAVFEKIRDVLKEGGVLAVVVMDIREGARFIPFHVDLSEGLRALGFELADIVVWDRRREYNNIRPIGYPNKFMINKVHEYILIFRR